MPMPFTYTYIECDFCGMLVPLEKQNIIRYEEEDATIGLCPQCFAEWKRERSTRDNGVIIKQEK